MTIVRKTLEAETDLVDVLAYVRQHNSTAAVRLGKQFEAVFELLAAHPFAGPSREEYAPSLRSFATGKYVIFYRINDNGLQIVRILHSSRDIDAVFEVDRDG